MQEAFVEFVGRLDPAELEARFERAARRGKLRGGGKAQAWELYADFYRNLGRETRRAHASHLRRGVLDRVSRIPEEETWLKAR